MTSPLSTFQLGRLSAFATETFGLRFPPDRWNELARGVASAALALGIPDLEGFAEELVSGQPTSEQLKALANHLTISETYFFRQRDTFAALENEIVPARLALRESQGRPLRIWSAGCASGEEAYSVAIQLRQKFPHARPEKIIITGTDINTLVLTRATRAVYSEWSFRDAPDWLKPSYFLRKAPGRYELIQEIRRMVRFSQLNLAAPIYPAEFGERGDFDVILCRNTLMYFSAAWQEKIIHRFAQALAPGGWLIVGPCDVPAAQSSGLKLRASGPGVYQKIAATLPVADAALSPMAIGALLAPRELAPTPPTHAGTWPATPTHETSLALPVHALPSPEVAALFAPPEAATALEQNVSPLAPAATESDVASALAHAHADRGELDPALAACEQAIASNTLNPAAHYLRACILQEQNRAADAEAAFRRVLYLDPHHVMAQFALACLAMRQDRPEEARHHFALVLRSLHTESHGAAVPGTDGLTVARLRTVVENTLAHHAA